MGFALAVALPVASDLAASPAVVSRDELAVAGTAGNGSLTVTDAVAGNVTIALAAVEAAKLRTEAGLEYEFKMITATAVQQLSQGKWNISEVVTEAIT